MKKIEKILKKMSPGDYSWGTKLAQNKKNISLRRKNHGACKLTRMARLLKKQKKYISGKKT